MESVRKGESDSFVADSDSTLDAPTRVGPARRLRERGWAGRLLVGLVLVLGGFAVVFGWSVASPIGASPDDDFHEASIWCPTPLDQSCAVSLSAEGYELVEVPREITDGSCYAFDPYKSGSCVSVIPDGTVWTSRVDNGLYPGGYYDVMHLLVGSDVYHSVVLMRIVSGCVAIALIALVTVFLPLSERRLLAYSTLSVCVPLLLYLVCSVNPSGWAITGLTVAWFGVHAAFMGSTWWRVVIPAAVAAVGTSMAALARADAGSYLVLAAVAMTILHWPTVRKKLWMVVFPAAMMAIGIIGYLSGGQSEALGKGMDMSSSGGTMQLFQNNLLQLPRLLIDYTAGFIGLNWVDTVMPPIVWVTVAALSLALMFFGMQWIDWRKSLALLGLIGAYVGLPLLILQQGGDSVGSMVQGRYIAPLVPLILSVALWRPKQGGAQRLSLAQTIILYIGLVVAHSVALHTQIRRFVTGLDVVAFNLNIRVEWWHAGPSPMMTWMLGSTGFAIVALVLFTVRRFDQSSAEAVADADVVGEASTR